MPELETFVPVPGGRLHVVADGEGPPIVLAHSAIVDLRSWDAMVPILVDAGYRAVRYDTRAWGQSTTDEVEYSDRADLLAVLDALTIRRAAVMGNSRGAMIALDTLIEAPDRFVAFAWMAGGIGGFEHEETVEERAAPVEMQAPEDSNDETRGPELDFAFWVVGRGQPETRLSGEIREAFLEMDRPLYAKDHVFGKPVRLSPPADERLGEVRVPTLVVVGELDTSATTRAAAARLAGGVPGARLVTWPDVAHLIGMEAPDRLAALIVEHLAPLPRWS